MKSTTIVNHVLGSIIKESKNILHDKAVTREKLPAYSNSKAEALNYGLIMHEGYGA
jgi:enhancing lycopene biosynthesis protein 2